MTVRRLLRLARWIGFWPGERVTVTVLPFAAWFFADGDCAVTTSAATLSL